MAVKKKTTKKAKRKTKNQWKKGQSGNPNGRPKMTDEQKELALRTRTQWKVILNNYLTLSVKELEEKIKEKNLPSLDVMTIQSILNSKRSGDQAQINWFLNHVLGK